MAKPEQKERAQKLRQAGNSIRNISHLLSVSVSSVSRWCETIKLSPLQREHLNTTNRESIRQGQLNGGLVRRQRRLARIAHHEQEAAKRFSRLRTNEFFTAGIALYLAEGAKTTRILDFTNSHLETTLFMKKWFEDFFAITPDRFRCSLLMNGAWHDKEKGARAFWSHSLNIPFHQFNQTVFTKYNQRKHHKPTAPYHGIMRLRILKSTDLFYKMMGLTNALLIAPRMRIKKQRL